MNAENVNIELTKEQAIVLLEFLGRFNDNDDLNRIEDQSEQLVLWGIECLLEKELSEPFRADYLEILKIARETVRDEKE